jgi:hypothetical protein
VTGIFDEVLLVGEGGLEAIAQQLQAILSRSDRDINDAIATHPQERSPKNHL